MSINNQTKISPTTEHIRKVSSQLKSPNKNETNTVQDNKSSFNNLSYINSHINKFKEEMILQFKDIENKVYLETVDFRKEIIQKSNNLESLMNNNQQKIDYLNEVIATANNKSEKIVNLEDVNKKLNETVFSQGLKITNLEKKLSDTLYKYEKIYVDSLVIPGLIGDFCRYKTFREFVEYTDTTVHNLVSHKDKSLLEMKSYKEKLESLIKELHLTINKIEKNNKDYTKLQMSALERIIDSNKKDFDSQLHDNRLENTKHAKDLLVRTELLKVESNKIEEFKNQVNDDIKKGIDQMKVMNNDNREAFESVKGDFLKIKRRFKEIAEFIKDVRFRRNLGVDYKRQDMKQLSEKIDYNKKKKNSYDEENNDNYYFNDVHSDDEAYIHNNNINDDDKDIELDKPNPKSDTEVDNTKNSNIANNHNSKNHERKVKIIDERTSKNNNSINTDKKETHIITNYRADKIKVESILKDYIHGKGELPVSGKKCKHDHGENSNHTCSKNHDHDNSNINTNNVQDFNVNFDSKLNNLITSIKEEQDEDYTLNSSKIIKNNRLLPLSQATSAHNSNRNTLNMSNDRQKNTNSLEKLPKTGISKESTVNAASIEKVNSLSYEVSQLRKDVVVSKATNKKIDDLETYTKQQLNDLLMQIKQIMSSISSTTHVRSSNSNNIGEKNTTSNLSTSNLNINSSNIANNTTTGFNFKSIPQMLNNTTNNNYSKVIPTNGNFLIADSVYNKNVVYNIIETSGLNSNSYNKTKSAQSNKQVPQVNYPAISSSNGTSKNVKIAISSVPSSSNNNTKSNFFSKTSSNSNLIKNRSMSREVKQ